MVFPLRKPETWRIGFTKETKQEVTLNHTELLRDSCAGSSPPVIFPLCIHFGVNIIHINKGNRASVGKHCATIGYVTLVDDVISQPWALTHDLDNTAYEADVIRASDAGVVTGLHRVSAESILRVPSPGMRAATCNATLRSHDTGAHRSSSEQKLTSWGGPAPSHPFLQASVSADSSPSCFIFLQQRAISLLKSHHLIPKLERQLSLYGRAVIKQRE